MSDTLIRNIGQLVTGDLGSPTSTADSIHVEDGVIREVGATATTADTVIDARGTTVAPGLIDGHIHPVAGQYTPRQQTLNWCESYLHGGVTSMVSAGEIHHPGRPTDADGLRSLAVLNAKSYANQRPGGTKVHAGTLVLSDDLTVEDVEAAHEQGVERTKIIFAMEDTDHVRTLVDRAKELGMVTMMHAGGASVPGTRSIGEDLFKAIRPDIALHFNGGPTPMPDPEWRALIADTDMDLELVVAGNQRTSVAILETVRDRDEMDRLQVATDTPTGTGVVPCGMWLEMGILAGMTDVPGADVVCLATGNPARHHGLDEGFVETDRPADLLVLDAPVGSAADDALGAIDNGEYPSVDKVLVDGEVLVDGSRNTGPPKRSAVVE